MKDARAIVADIVREIDARVPADSIDSDVSQRLQEAISEVEAAVIRDFSRGRTGPYLAQIEKIFGREALEALDPKKIGSFVRRGKDKQQRTYQKLAVLLECYRYYKKTAQRAAAEAKHLKTVQNELVEAQVSHVQEAEMLEASLQKARLLTEIVVEPFEDAIKRVMSFLQANQLEVFLFDDDKFLAAELKTDGQTFLYNSGEDHQPAAPASVSKVTLQEIQETSLEVPLLVGGSQIGHYRVTRQITADFEKDAWKAEVEFITPALARSIDANRNRLLARKVYIDDLTLLYNKRKLNEQMGKLFNQFKQGEKSLHVAMLDIDHFKNLNDTYGHPVGDRILKKTAALIKKAVPNAYRYGGEEFAAVFYGFEKDQAIKIIEQLRAEIEATAYVIDAQEYRITISAGIAEFNTSMNSVMDAINHADQALYISKQDGRNRCTYFDDVKERLSADASRLRQEILQLQTKVKQLSMLEEENKRLVERLRCKR